jgi:hypothetical protein
MELAIIMNLGKIIFMLVSLDYIKYLVSSIVLSFFSFIQKYGL